MVICDCALCCYLNIAIYVHSFPCLFSTFATTMKSHLRYRIYSNDYDDFFLLLTLYFFPVPRKRCFFDSFTSQLKFSSTTWTPLIGRRCQRKITPSSVGSSTSPVTFSTGTFNTTWTTCSWDWRSLALKDPKLLFSNLRGPTLVRFLIPTSCFCSWSCCQRFMTTRIRRIMWFSVSLNWPH